MQRATDKKGKRFFEVLRDEEMEHLKYLRERLDEWTTTGKIQVEALDTAIPSRDAIDHGLQEIREVLATEAPSGKGRHMTELDLLKKALDVEADTYVPVDPEGRELEGVAEKIAAP